MNEIVLQITRVFPYKVNGRTSYLWYTARRYEMESDNCRIHFHGDFCESKEWNDININDLISVIETHMKETLAEVSR
jgi:hypothetical protein